MDVAPRAGAWIETHIDSIARSVGMCVAPRAGAWIETSADPFTRVLVPSLPMREGD